MQEKPKVSVVKELAGNNTLTLSLLKPRSEGYGESATLDLAPTQDRLTVADWRTEVNLDEVVAAFPGKNVTRRNILIVDLDQETPTIETHEFATNENPFSPDYRLINKMDFSDGKTTYATSYEGTTEALKTGERKTIGRMSPTSTLQRHAIGIAQDGDLAGQTVFTDYRITMPDTGEQDEVFVDAMMFHGSQEKVKGFLEQVAKTEAPVTTHSEPAFDANGRATY